MIIVQSHRFDSEKRAAGKLAEKEAAKATDKTEKPETEKVGEAAAT